jgi:hypothetical protein
MTRHFRRSLFHAGSLSSYNPIHTKSSTSPPHMRGLSVDTLTAYRSEFVMSGLGSPPILH